MTTLTERVEAARDAGRMGEDWMSKPAQDMVRLAVFAGFDAKELVTRVAKRSSTGKTNVSTVLTVMGQMEDEDRAAHPEWFAEQDTRREVARRALGIGEVSA